SREFNASVHVVLSSCGEDGSVPDATRSRVSVSAASEARAEKRLLWPALPLPASIRVVPAWRLKQGRSLIIRGVVASRRGSTRSEAFGAVLPGDSDRASSTRRASDTLDRVLIPPQGMT